MSENPGRIFVFFGTQGSGRKLLARTVQTRTGVKNLVKFSTRPPRADDVNGMDNHFVTDAEFDRMDAEGVFLDTVVSDEDFRFGVARSDVEKVIANGKIAFITAPAPMKRLKEAFQENVTRIFVYTGRQAFRTRLEKSRMTRFEISSTLKRYDQRSVYGRTCEHAVLHESFADAFAEILSIVRSYQPAGPTPGKWP